MSDIEIRKVEKNDFQNIQKFVDKWLSGRAIKEGGGNDYFVTKNQHKSYFKNYHVYIALDKDKIIGWLVKEKSNVLIHLLIDPYYRGKGIGKQMMTIANPDIIRSKSDQQTGDPKLFYERLGYKIVIDSKVGKKKNIDMMSK